MTRMLAIVGALACVALTGCGPEIQKTEAQCELDADKLYSSATPDTRANLIGDYVYTCMKARGYRGKADPSCDDVYGEFRADCYEWNTGLPAAKPPANQTS